MAKSVRNTVADRRRIGFAGSGRCVGRMALHTSGYHVPPAAIHHKSVGLRGGHRDLFMIDALRNICPVRMAGDEAESSKAQKRSESSIVLNKFGPSGHGEAQVQYLDGDFRVISPGTYVRCAMTDARIPLDELKYWSVDLQEAYAVPSAVLQRHFPGALKA